jgi:hypothetical protein
MKKWIVEVMVIGRVEVEADTQEDAERIGLERFDPTANDPDVYDSWEVDEDNWEK